MERINQIPPYLRLLRSEGSCATRQIDILHFRVLSILNYRYSGFLRDMGNPFCGLDPWHCDIMSDVARHWFWEAPTKIVPFHIYLCLHYQRQTGRGRVQCWAALLFYFISDARNHIGSAGKYSNELFNHIITFPDHKRPSSSSWRTQKHVLQARRIHTQQEL